MLDLVVTVAVIIVPVILALVLIDAIHGSVAAYRTRYEELGAAGAFSDQPVDVMPSVRRTEMPVQERPAAPREVVPDVAGTPGGIEPTGALPIIGGVQPRSAGQHV